MVPPPGLVAKTPATASMRTGGGFSPWLPELASDGIAFCLRPAESNAIWPSCAVVEALGAEAWANTVHPHAASTHGQDNRTRRRSFRNRNVCMAALCFDNQFRYSAVILKSIGKLQNQLAWLRGGVAVDKLIFAFEEQRVRDIVNTTHAVPTGPGSKPVVQGVVAAHDLEVV